MLLLDVEHKCWSNEMLDICGVQESQLPKLFESWQPVGTLTAEAAQMLGLPADVVVCAGAGDNAAAAVGCGAVSAIFPWAHRARCSSPAIRSASISRTPCTASPTRTEGII